MLKNIAISIFGAMAFVWHPWFRASDRMEKIAIMLGLAIVLFIFLLFLEETVTKVRKVREMRRMLGQIAGIKIGEKRLRYEKRKVTGNSKMIGRKS